MMTRVVQFSDDAYRRLRVRKRKGESFSDVVVRLTTTSTLATLEGTLSSSQARQAKKWIRQADELDRA